MPVMMSKPILPQSCERNPDTRLLKIAGILATSCGMACTSPPASVMMICTPDWMIWGRREAMPPTSAAMIAGMRPTNWGIALTSPLASDASSRTPVLTMPGRLASSVSTMVMTTCGIMAASVGIAATRPWMRLVTTCMPDCMSCGRAATKAVMIVWTSRGICSPSMGSAAVMPCTSPLRSCMPPSMSMGACAMSAVIREVIICTAAGRRLGSACPSPCTSVVISSAAVDNSLGAFALIVPISAVRMAAPCAIICGRFAGDLHAQILQHARQLRAQPADHGEQLPLHALVEHAESRDQCGDDGADAEELDEVARAEEARDQAADRVQAGLQPWPDDAGYAAEGVSDGPEHGLRLARDAGCDASELASERLEPDDHGIILERERG